MGSTGEEEEEVVDEAAEEEMIRYSIIALSEAMESMEVEQILHSVQQVRENQNRNVTSAVQGKIEEAENLIRVLSGSSAAASTAASPSASAPVSSGGNFAADSAQAIALLQEAKEHSIVSPEETKLALKTVRKILSNVAKDPTDPKYRKVRLENPAIKSRIVEPCNGSVFPLFLFSFRFCSFSKT